MTKHGKVKKRKFVAETEKSKIEIFTLKNTLQKPGFAL